MESTMGKASRDLRADEFDPILIAAENIENRKPFAMVTVVGAPTRSEVQLGLKAVFDTNGNRTAGWTGSDILDTQVAHHITAGLHDEVPRVVEISLDSRKDHVVAVLVEPILPPPMIWLFGTGTVAEAICELGASLGFDMVVAHKMARARDYPAAIRLIGEVGDQTVVRPMDRDFVVVLGDATGWFSLLKTALAGDAHYVGLVAGAVIAREAVRRLRESENTGHARLHAPCGFEIGARSPNETALSVMGEIVGRRRLGHLSRTGVDQANLEADSRRDDLPRPIALAW
jgi:xanthine dehydrogenase accessory factor